MLLSISVIAISLFGLWLIFGGHQYADGVGRFLSVRNISGLDGGEYLLRRYLVPRNRYFNIYLHQFLDSDDDRALHDHPWVSVSILLKGELIEHLPNGDRQMIRRGRVIYRSPTYLHRIELPENQSATTLFITGPVVRKWGFVCPRGWMAFDRYNRNGGCD